MIEKHEFETGVRPATTRAGRSDHRPTCADCGEQLQTDDERKNGRCKADHHYDPYAVFRPTWAVPKWAIMAGMLLGVGLGLLLWWFAARHLSG